jgi:hypothetical protein
VQDTGHHLHFERGLGLDASGLAHDPVDQFGLVLLHQRRDLAQDRGALVVRRGCPTRLRGPRLGGGLANVLGGGIADAGDDGARRGLEHIERTADGGPPLRAEQTSAPCRLDEDSRYRRVHPRMSSPAAQSRLCAGVWESAIVRSPKANMDHAAFERADDRIQPVLGGQDYRLLCAGGHVEAMSVAKGR